MTKRRRVHLKEAVLVDPQTTQSLGYADVLEALAARCATSLGKERALKRPFLSSSADIEAQVQLIAEARELEREQVHLPLSDIEDIRPTLEAAIKGALIEPRAFVSLARALRSMTSTRSILGDWQATAPGLLSIAERIVALDELAKRLESTFEAGGEISDSASFELKEARQRARGLHRNIKSRLERMLEDERFVQNLRETYFSLRNDRYVLPVLAQHRAAVPGIVHNASQSGQTLFIEPEAVIALGNDLTIAQSVVAEEERRILEDLGARVARQAEEIRSGLEASAELDEATGAALLAKEMDASTAAICTDPSLELLAMRHPRLLLRGSKVVANDVRLLEPVRGLVISGPNAGGKTIALTGIGLCVLMARAGLQIPAAEGSKIPWYDSVHAMVGDAQDLNAGLSTFSAHVRRLWEIEAHLEGASLALIDEIAADTDPREGAALASAYLIDLADRGAHAVVTTHLEEVKALAHLDHRFQNGRVGFDPLKMAPTYRLQLGLAGSSSAIEIAEQAGMPERICRQARQLLAGSGGALAQALAHVENERRQVDAEREKARAAEAAAEREKNELSSLRRQLERGRQSALLLHQENLAEELERAKAEIKTLLESLRAQSSAQAAARAQEEMALRLEEAKQRAEETRAKLEPKRSEEAPEALRVGGWAKHRTLKQRVEILELDQTEALVASGAVKMRVPIRDLVGIRSAPWRRFPGKNEGTSEALARGTAAAPGTTDGPNRRCDIRGLRASDALREVEAFLDGLFREGAEDAVILHGHGTGALKQVVRDYLDRSPYIRMFRPGDSSEGGDGVTVVAFRA